MKTKTALGLLLSLLTVASCVSTKPVSNLEKDGSSFEQAIVVNSVAEEYQYVRGVCANCKLLGQSLRFEKKKPYDVLRLETADGQEVSYYFNISRFFGKEF
jgi:hypothetical protein